MPSAVTPSGSAAEPAAEEVSASSSPKSAPKHRAARQGSPDAKSARLRRLEEINQIDFTASEGRDHVEQLRHTAYLGRFTFALDPKRKDNISAIWLTRQVRITEEAVKEVKAKLETGGKSVFFRPPQIAITPETIDPDVLASIKELTRSSLTLVEYSEQVRKANLSAEALAELDSKFHRPSPTSNIVLVPRGGYSDPDAKDFSKEQAFHLLDGQKRVEAMLRLQRSMTGPLKQRWKTFDADVWDWTQIAKDESFLGALVNPNQEFRTHPLPADALKRKLIEFNKLYEDNFARYAPAMEEYERTEAAGASQSGKGERKRGKVDDLDLLVRKDAALRTTLYDTLTNTAAFTFFRSDPLIKLMNAGMPELATYASALWSTQQQIITTALVTYQNGDLKLQRVPQMLIDEAFTKLVTLMNDPSLKTRASLVARGCEVLDKLYSFSRADASQNDEGTQAWRRVFGHSSVYLQFRVNMLYAAFGPHSEHGALVRHWEGNYATETSERQWWMGEGHHPALLHPLGWDHRWFGASGVHEAALVDDSPGQESADAFVQQNQLEWLKEHYLASEQPSAGLTSYAMLADPATLDTFLKKPAITTLLADLKIVLQEVASMIDPLYVQAIITKQSSVIETVGGVCVGSGPAWEADDGRHSCFKLLFGALAASSGVTPQQDVREDGDAVLKAHGETKQIRHSAIAAQTIGPALIHLWQYLCENAAELAHH
ncbi:hypothetical protein OC842_007841, partial [Tilletia horrida]